MEKELSMMKMEIRFIVENGKMEITHHNIKFIFTT